MYCLTVSRANSATDISALHHLFGCICRGDSGYIKIARGHHGCGITTDPVYAVFDGKHQFELAADDAFPTA